MGDNAYKIHSLELAITIIWFRKFICPLCAGMHIIRYLVTSIRSNQISSYFLLEILIV